MVAYPLGIQVSPLYTKQILMPSNGRMVNDLLEILFAKYLLNICYMPLRVRIAPETRKNGNRGAGGPPWLPVGKKVGTKWLALPKNGLGVPIGGFGRHNQVGGGYKCG